MQDQEIAKILLKIGSVKINPKEPFTYTSGMLSPIYVDNRLLISYPSERNVVLEKLAALVKEFSPEPITLAGTATAAIPWAAFLAQKLDYPMVYVRPEPKKHGAKKQVEGTMEKGAKALVVEDMISTGGSSLGSAEALQREYNADVLGVIAFYNYELQASKDNFSKKDLPLKYLTNFDTVVETAISEGTIKEDDKELVMKWREEGMDWGKRFKA